MKSSRHLADLGGADDLSIPSYDPLDQKHSHSLSHPLDPSHATSSNLNAESLRGDSSWNTSTNVYRSFEVSPSGFSSIQEMEKELVYRSLQHGTVSGGFGGVVESEAPLWRSMQVSEPSLSDSSPDHFPAFHAKSNPHELHQPFASQYTLNPKHQYPSPIVSSILVGGKVLEPPDVPGGYLEPCYHFVSRSQPSKLLDSLLLTLQSHQVDFSVKQDKFKISCRSYRNSDSLTFIVRVFSANVSKSAQPNTNKQYAVEFQRRTGDILKFSELYRSCKQALHTDGHCETTNSDLPPPQKLSAPSLPDNAATTDQVIDSLQCLLQMASSTFVDVKANAMHVLSELTATDRAVQDLVLSAGGLDTLLDSLHTKFEDVHRCALSALANLAEKRAEVCRKIMSGHHHLRQLYHLTNSETLQVVRESARILSNIGDQLGHAIVDADFKRTVDGLSLCTDPLARQRANHLIQTLRISI